MKKPAKKMNVVLVPAWIYRTLLSNGLTLNDLLDLNKVKKCLSLNELSMIGLFNEQDSRVFSTAITTENYLLDSYLLGLWNNTDAETFNKINLIKSINTQSLNDRLLDTTGYENTLTKYEIKDQTSDIVFILIYPNMFENNTALYSPYSSELIRDLVRLWSQYNDYNVVANTYLYERYVCGL